MKTVLVYRDRLLPPSEQAFMRRQYMGFRTLRPCWVGCRRDAPAPDLPGDVRFLGGSGPLRPLRQMAFRQFGWGAAREVADLAPVLVHAQFGRGGALALSIARALGVPLVVTFHGGDAFKDRHYAGGFPPSVFQRRWQALQSHAALFVCVSEGVRDRLLERGVPARLLEVIPIGAEPAPLAAGPADRFVFAGRFVDKKGVPVLIDAVRILAGRGVTPPVVLAGDGPLLPAMRDRAAGLANLRFAGWLGAADLAAEMDRAIALLVPSVVPPGGDREGLPSVAVEAMARGVPVVASSQSGLEGAVGHAGAGIVVPAGDPMALADAMQAMLVPRTRDAMAGAAAATARESFCAPVQSARLEARLLSLLPGATG
ncbi:glycosyl transferase group 1 [Gluconacetobacter diazotrophicus PA1 5]|uniref:glycosyltransferase n=1 Tax=Gluconacetobacter diazotrophicus TaxID=33996 RepID=UPI000173B365|nr:glycosyltransferase [Gluconacetobacter diazotrophicus]ACI52831.1 glycosyl transferase group 1 [Gluconacetobacter diazotrophicus PA1 5]TWB09024.1 glycosyltransferase involved in cell wall biosynthesis [Gluconacetobacter diazotrophicus]